MTVNDVIRFRWRGSERLKASEFRLISRLAHERFGLDLKRGKEALVAARLGKWLRQGGFKSFDDYYRHVLADSTGEALIGLIDSLTTNHTSFLREKAHFEFLARAVVGGVRRLATLEIWSAACSSGEEPYTIAMCLSDALARAPEAAATFKFWPPTSRRECWDGQARRSIRANVFANCRTPGGEPICCGATASPRDCSSSSRSWPARISFERLNLIEPFPRRRVFQVIFCRNVMMYFDQATQQDIVQRLSGCLEPGGYLLVGHSESLTGVEHELELCAAGHLSQGIAGRGCGAHEIAGSGHFRLQGEQRSGFGVGDLRVGIVHRGRAVRSG